MVVQLNVAWGARDARAWPEAPLHAQQEQALEHLFKAAEYFVADVSPDQAVLRGPT